MHAIQVCFIHLQRLHAPGWHGLRVVTQVRDMCCTAVLLSYYGALALGASLVMGCCCWCGTLAAWDWVMLWMSAVVLVVLLSSTSAGYAPLPAVIRVQGGLGRAAWAGQVRTLHL